MNGREPRVGAAATRIAIVDAQPLYRSGVALALASQSDLEVVDQGECGKDTLQIASRHPIDILLVDIAVEGGGIQMLTSLARSWPELKVIVLTASEREGDVSNAMRCGVRGYLLKHITERELATAVRAVAKGDVYLAPSLGARLFARTSAMTPPVPQASAVDELTPREAQILTHVSLGATNKEIANALNLTEKTVKYYMTNIMQKLQVRNRVEAVLILREKSRKSA